MFLAQSPFGQGSSGMADDYNSKKQYVEPNRLGKSKKGRPSKANDRFTRKIRSLLSPEAQSEYDERILQQNKQATRDISAQKRAEYRHRYAMLNREKTQGQYTATSLIPLVRTEEPTVIPPLFPDINIIEQVLVREILETTKEIYNRINQPYDEFISDCDFPEDDMMDDEQSGGAIDLCRETILKALKIYVPDTLHDFGKKDRNGIFPTDFSPANFLKKAKQFLSGNIVTGDMLTRDYCEHWPGNFEEQVKIDFLLGILCPPFNPDIYYFFSQPPPWTYSESDPRQQFFQQHPYGNIPLFFKQISEAGFKYYVFDAVMSVHKEPEWTRTMTELEVLLCNLWDPAGSGTIHGKTIDITNSTIKELKLNMTETDKIKDGFTIIETFGTRTDRQQFNFDDVIYDDLFEQCLPDGFSIKLRLATNKIMVTTNDRDFTYKIFEPDSIVRAAIIILSPGGAEDIFLTDGGYPVVELSTGLLYIENNYMGVRDINPRLKEIIDSVRGRLLRILGNKPADVKKYLYILLTRFKSTGDHGSAMTTKVINEQLGINTLYLSGDQLAYIYAIILEVPTVFKYYSAKSETSDSGDKERVHFVGAYLPERDKRVTLIRQYNEMLSWLTVFLSRRGGTVPEIGDADDINRIIDVKVGPYYGQVESVIVALYGGQSVDTVSPVLTPAITDVAGILNYRTDILSRSTEQLSEGDVAAELKLLEALKKLVYKYIYVENYTNVSLVKAETRIELTQYLRILLNENHPSIISRFKAGVKSIFSLGRRQTPQSVYSKKFEAFKGKSLNFIKQSIKPNSEQGTTIETVKTRILTAVGRFNTKISTLFGETPLTGQLKNENVEECNSAIRELMVEEPNYSGLSEYLIERLSEGVATVGGKKRRTNKIKPAHSNKKRMYRNKTMKLKRTRHNKQ